jgi:hypothetical protein
MPRNQEEETKKHGDTLEGLIDSTGPGKRKSSEGNKPSEIEDDDDDVENDDLEDRPDVPATD